MARYPLVVAAAVGLAASVWIARPAEFADVGGWAFAILWSSIAWLLVLTAVLRALPIAAAIGALLGLIAFEIFAFSRGLNNDALFLAIKPVVESVLAVAGGLSGALVAKVGQDA